MTRAKDTPLMRQYNEVKKEHGDSIVLFRMGDFYETFGKDAKITAKILGIVLTKRSNGAAKDVPLAGFPYHSLDNYLHKLVNAGHRVAICEQIEDPKLAKGIVKREVVEVVTPGTITAEQALDHKTNHYLASLHFGKNKVGYAVLDQSTGEFFLGDCEPEYLTESLRKFSPREILIGESIVYSTASWYIELKPFISKVEDWVFNYDRSYRSLIEHFNVKTLKGFGCEPMIEGITAAGVVFYHLLQSLGSRLNHISSIKPIIAKDMMGLDGFTIRNLEIFKSLATQGTHGTLIDVIDKTLTAGGGRMLKRWINRPLTNRNRLNSRLDVVEALYSNNRPLENIRLQLKELHDIERILGRINNGKASPKEINGLRQSLEQIPKVISVLKESKNNSLKVLGEKFRESNSIVEFIDKRLNPEAPVQIKQGNVFLKGVDRELDQLRTLSTDSKNWIAKLQSSERERTGISSLKIGFNRVFGYFLEITKVHIDKVPDEYIRKQTLANSERFITPELKDYEEKILSADQKIESIELRLFNELCEHILSKGLIVQENAVILSRLDVLATFAEIAIANKYVRPILNESGNLQIEEGRHPVVERLLPATDRFVPNNLSINVDKNQIHLITGPNMAGKSTFLRQTGIIVLMAQFGSFVPAKSAKIGLVDKLFTRVGASDNLAGGESTFLVEMNEAANIINNATKQSLVLLDEIGRGTATYDGLSLAWAITEYLHNLNEVSARTLFATHYHELTKLEESLDRLENFHIAVKEHGDKIVFLRKIKPGTGDKSYGIYVAKMAGLPNSIIKRASQILDFHLANHPADQNNGSKFLEKELSFFAKEESLLSEALIELDVLNLSPIEVVRRIDKIKKEHGL